ncbi:hypothetical protein EV361DRAFT_925665 [Lentinula raphanica]|uniref:Cleavage stimulation factor subunit 2 hinge domain-containing protein n=1 Tax=Lentinula raphanica TaxID=153919 RepID=A0AA38UF69_9AGAR|nr:hypothetical protein F5878DRAFT_616876 [Lentinula raphanica]KAJ3968478.1 hypothetical protein EV361DRAFT_925665 [Lentinula raphanica]
MSEQLIELMLQLKKTTPAAAKQILNSQPQIAYALMSLMVSLNAVNFEVFQKTLADFSQGASQPHPQPQTQATSQPPPPSQSYHRPTPPPYSQPPAANAYPSYTSSAQTLTLNPAILAAIPDDQKAMVIQVLSMTPEQLAVLPPQDRANILQLRSTFGL